MTAKLPNDRSAIKGGERGKVEGVKAQTRLRAETFKRLALDRNIPHGAVRLFMLLYTFVNKKNSCWPGQRRLQKSLGCSTSSLKPWVEKLVGAGYLKTETVVCSKGVATVYHLNFSGVSPVLGAPGGVSGSGTGVSGFKGGVSKTRNETNSIQLNSMERNSILKKKKSQATVSPTEPVTVIDPSQRPFTETEFDEDCDKNHYEPRYYGNFLSTNDGHWDEIRKWKCALRCYVQRCRKNEVWKKKKESNRGGPNNGAQW